MEVGKQFGVCLRLHRAVVERGSARKLERDGVILQQTGFVVVKLNGGLLPKSGCVLRCL